MPAPSALKLLSSRLYVGAACTNKLCSCHSLSQGFCLPVLKKQFQRQYVLESSIKKRISSQRAETPVLHLLRRVPGRSGTMQDVHPWSWGLQLGGCE